MQYEIILPFLAGSTGGSFCSLMMFFPVFLKKWFLKDKLKHYVLCFSFSAVLNSLPPRFVAIV